MGGPEIVTSHNGDMGWEDDGKAGTVPCLCPTGQVAGGL